MPRISVTHYGDQLAWRHRMIGLTERSQQYVDRGYTPLRQAHGSVDFRRFGMPFSPAVKDHVAGTSPACRAVVAVRRAAPERELAAFRALQRMQFTTAGQLDVPADLEAGLADVEGIDAAAIVAAIEDDAVWADYEDDRAAARSAEGTPGHAQGKTFDSDGAERYTAPSLVFVAGDATLEAAGFQSFAVYDALLANLDPTLDRRPAPDDVADLLRAFPDGLTTMEVAQVHASGAAVEVDRAATEYRLLDAVAAGTAVRRPVGDDALWLAT